MLFCIIIRQLRIHLSMRSLCCFPFTELTSLLFSKWKGFNSLNICKLVKRVVNASQTTSPKVKTSDAREYSPPFLTSGAALWTGMNTSLVYYKSAHVRSPDRVSCKMPSIQNISLPPLQHSLGQLLDWHKALGSPFYLRDPVTTVQWKYLLSLCRYQYMLFMIGALEVQTPRKKDVSFLLF